VTKKHRRPYRVGERVQLRGCYGVTGHVLQLIYRNRPPSFGYLPAIAGEQREVRGADVIDPPRQLLQEYRRWQDDGFGQDYVQLLDDRCLAQLQREWIEVHPTLARAHPRFIPHRIDGLEPIHRAKIARTTDRYETWSSNGAHRRVRERATYWLSCPCGWRTVAETSREARHDKEEHEHRSDALASAPQDDQVQDDPGAVLNAANEAVEQAPPTPTTPDTPDSTAKEQHVVRPIDDIRARVAAAQAAVGDIDTARTEPVTVADLGEGDIVTAVNGVIFPFPFTLSTVQDIGGLGRKLVADHGWFAPVLRPDAPATRVLAGKTRDHA
jgi:hypothetical protein